MKTIKSIPSTARYNDHKIFKFRTIFKIIVLLFVAAHSLEAQELFIPHEIDNNFTGACSVCSYDLDGDGNLDILAAGDAGNQIAWWKNENGSPISFSKYLIDSNATGIMYVDAADIDNDGDIDVLGASWLGNEVAIWKNEGGDPVNWEKIVVDSLTAKAHEVHAAYIDTDSLPDIIAAFGGDHEVVWYRNDGGNPVSWEKNIVDNQFTGARSVISFDINNDGFNDLIGGALTANEISIWLNSGTNPIQWDKQIIDNSFGGAHWVYAIDLDKDDDLDILGAGAIPGSIAWWQNDGGNPIQWNKQIISSSFSGALSVAAADLDLDNDIDVFGAAINANRVTWWDNDGNVPINWGTNTLLNGYAGAWPVFGIDLDEDGDTDILTTASNENKVTWLENTTFTTEVEEINSIIPHNLYLSQNYPNPFNPSTKIKYSISSKGYVSLKVYDVLGNKIETLVNEEKPAGYFEVKFDANSLPGGIYIYQLNTGLYTSTKKMLLLK